VIADEQLVANEDLMLESTPTRIEATIRLMSIRILVTSLLSVKRKPSRNSYGAYVVALDDEYLIVHRVIQRTLIAYAYGAVFADLRKVPDPEARGMYQRKRARIQGRGSRYTYLLCSLELCQSLGMF